MPNQPNKLRHGDSERSSCTGNIPRSGFNDIHCLGQQRWIVGVLRTDSHSLALPPLLPEIAACVAIGVDSATHPTREFQPQPPPRHTAVVLLAPTFCRHDLNAAWNVSQVHR